MPFRFIALVGSAALALLFSPSHAVAGGASAELPAGFRLEGTWSIRPPSGIEDGKPRHFVHFGAANSVIWYESSETGCTSSRHRYWNRRDRLLVEPSLPGNRSWWEPLAESTSRIMVIERFAEQPPRSQRVQLVRASLPEGCATAEPVSRNPG